MVLQYLYIIAAISSLSAATSAATSDSLCKTNHIANKSLNVTADNWYIYQPTRVNSSTDMIDQCTRLCCEDSGCDAFTFTKSEETEVGNYTCSLIGCGGECRLKAEPGFQMYLVHKSSTVSSEREDNPTHITTTSTSTMLVTTTEGDNYIMTTEDAIADTSSSTKLPPTNHSTRKLHTANHSPTKLPATNHNSKKPLTAKHSPTKSHSANHSPTKNRRLHPRIRHGFSRTKRTMLVAVVALCSTLTVILVAMYCIRYQRHRRLMRKGYRHIGQREP